MLIKKVPLQIKPPSNVVVCIADTRKEITSYMSDNGFAYPDNIETGDDMNGYIAPVSGGDIHFIIFIGVSAGEIAHEVQHMLNRVFDDIGYRYKLLNDELPCALLEYFVNYVIDMISVAKREKNIK